MECTYCKKLVPWSMVAKEEKKSVGRLARGKLALLGLLRLRARAPTCAKWELESATSVVFLCSQASKKEKMHAIPIG